MLDRRVVVIVWALWAGCTAVPCTPDHQPTEAPLIPVTTFFANPEASGEYQVSPDGEKLGWIAMADGRFTVRVRPTKGAGKEVEYVVFEGEGHGGSSSWSNGSSRATSAAVRVSERPPLSSSARG